MTASMLPKDAPSAAEISKVSSSVLQYIFDLEAKVEESFHFSHVVTVALFAFAAGWVIAKLL